MGANPSMDLPVACWIASTTIFIGIPGSFRSTWHEKNEVASICQESFFNTLPRVSLEEDFMSQYLQCCYPFISACHLEIHISIVIFNSLPAQREKTKLESFYPSARSHYTKSTEGLLLRLPSFLQLYSAVQD